MKHSIQPRRAICYVAPARPGLWWRRATVGIAATTIALTGLGVGTASADDGVSAHVSRSGSAQEKPGRTLGADTDGSDSRDSASTLKGKGTKDSDGCRSQAEGTARRSTQSGASAGSQSASGSAVTSAGSSTGATASVASTETVAATAGNLAVDGASLPLAQGTYRNSAQFGATGSWARYHTGMDFSASSGTPVYAVVEGTVVESGAGSWAGTHVVIRAADGSHTLYAHLSAKTVSPGTLVGAGQQIGTVGETGRAFGAHLHFEYYKPGERPGDVYSASNPATFLESLGLSF